MLLNSRAISSLLPSSSLIRKLCWNVSLPRINDSNAVQRVSEAGFVANLFGQLQTLLVVFQCLLVIASSFRELAFYAQRQKHPALIIEALGDLQSKITDCRSLGLLPV